jgi:hypothetical protein
MLLARLLGLSSDGITNFAPALLAAPASVAPCLTPRRSIRCRLGSDLSAGAFADDEVSVGISSGRAWAQRVF